MTRSLGWDTIGRDRGELIIARLGRDGYRELDRTPLIEPTSPASGRDLSIKDP